MEELQEDVDRLRGELRSESSEEEEAAGEEPPPDDAEIPAEPAGDAEEEPSEERVAEIQAELLELESK